MGGILRYMSSPVNHHFVPIFYLDRWAGSDGKVVVVVWIMGPVVRLPERNRGACRLPIFSIETILNMTRVNASNGDHPLKTGTLMILNCRRSAAMGTLSTKTLTDWRIDDVEMQEPKLPLALLTPALVGSPGTRRGQGLHRHRRAHYGGQSGFASGSVCCTTALRLNF